MIVSFPFTNPVAFDCEERYHNYFDAFRHEQTECYVQPWAEGDLISWQVGWYKRNANQSVNLRIDIVIDGVRRQYRTYSGIQGNATGGTFYSSYYVSAAESATYSNGYYVFSNKIENITDTSNHPLLQVGDRFHFVLTIEGRKYVSSPQVYVSDTCGTKLLHYSHTKKRLFDTQFTAVQKGYDIRLWAEFEHPEPAVNSEFMESYERDIELVSAVPAENIVLEIGRNRGVPDFLIRNLNHILHCDIKTIDGVAYELTPNAKIEPERVCGYNPAFLRVELAKRRSEFSLKDGAADNIPLPIIIGDNISVQVGYELAENVAWYIDDRRRGSLLNANVSQWNGIGNCSVRIALPRNLTAGNVVWPLQIRNSEDDSVIAEAEYVQARRMIGIGYGTVGDTLFVMERLYVN